MAGGGGRATPRAAATARATETRGRDPERRRRREPGRQARTPQRPRAVPGRVAAARADAAQAERDAADRARRAGRGLAQPLVVAGAVAVILGVLYLATPRMGQDLSAQLAHADFARDHPFEPVDLRWFGGALQFGYSLYVPLARGATSGRNCSGRSPPSSAPC